MIAVECWGCGRELDEPGALLFAPPDEFDRTELGRYIDPPPPPPIDIEWIKALLEDFAWDEDAIRDAAVGAAMHLYAAEEYYPPSDEEIDADHLTSAG